MKFLMNFWGPQGLNKNTKPWSFLLVLFFFLFSQFVDLFSKSHSQKKNLTILISIDGFPSAFWNSPEACKLTPFFCSLQKKGRFFPKVQSVNPSITFPAHTSMTTGKDPGTHGIVNNSYSIPQNQLKNSEWFWFSEEIRSKTIWKILKEKRKTTANVFWPVTVGEKIDHSVPQYYHHKSEFDRKYLRAFSTTGLYSELEKQNIFVEEISSDLEKWNAAKFIIQKYKPYFLALYTTDLDTTEHSFGPNSVETQEMLQKTDKIVQDFFTSMQSWNAQKKVYHQIQYIFVSDHGFTTATSICYPAVALKQKGFVFESGDSIHSFGGGAYLYSQREFSAKELENLCPKLEVVVKEIDVQGLISQMNPDAKAIFLSKTDSMVVSDLSNSEVSYKDGVKIHTHGFSNSLSSMDTIALVYPKSTCKKTISSVKDVFGCLVEATK